MRRFLLDTGPAQKFVSKDPAVTRIAKERRIRGDVIGICVPVLGELWSGVEGSNARDLNARRLLNQLSRLVLWPYDKPAAAEFGRIFTLLKRMNVRCSIHQRHLSATATSRHADSPLDPSQVAIYNCLELGGQSRHTLDRSSEFQSLATSATKVNSKVWRLRLRK